MRKPTVKKQVQSIDIAEEFIKDNYTIRYNTVSNILEMREKNVKESSWYQMDEEFIYNQFKRCGIKYSMNDTRALVKEIGFRNNYDPFIEYFTSLHWDGVERIDQLATYLTVEDQEFFNVQFKKMFVRCVACALDPNVFNKHAFVLVQPGQSTGKTSFCRWICPEELREYYTESYGGHDKDDLSALCDNFYNKPR